MVDEIRNKWCDDLEDLVQCPICMERPKHSIYQCVQGHHICQTCKPQLDRCPTCGQNWSQSRNRFAEHLCLKLDEIKLSLIDPENEINKLLIPDTVSVASQTEEAVVAVAPRQKLESDAHGSKLYPCRIGACNVQKSYDPLVAHLIIDHGNQFSEIPSNGHVFEHTWSFEFTEQLAFDRAFLIADMGSFFLKLSSDIFGTFTGFILMIHNGFVAKHYTYQLEISCCPQHTCPIYTSEVCSCRTPMAVLREKSLRISREQMQKMITHKKQLQCTVLLGKKPVTEDIDQSRQKFYQKNKNPRYNAHASGQNAANGSSAGPSSYQPNFHKLPRPRTAPANQALRSRTNSRQRRPSTSGSSVNEFD